MNIVFGTIKKAVRDTMSNEKYAGRAVVTVEGVKGENKSRRVLFNNTAMELLKIPVGAQQNMIFGFVEADDSVNRRLLIANADLLLGKEETVVYSVSKNKAAYDDSKEKGKAIASSPLIKEINTFLEVDENITHEYELAFFGENSGLDLYEMKKIVSETDGKSINDLVVNPLSYTGYNQNELMEASLDNDIQPINKEEEELDCPSVDNGVSEYESPVEVEEDSIY
jgi:hypothetical protein